MTDLVDGPLFATQEHNYAMACYEQLDLTQNAGRIPEFSVSCR